MSSASRVILDASWLLRARLEPMSDPIAGAGLSSFCYFHYTQRDFKAGAKCSKDIRYDRRAEFETSE